MSRSSFEPNTPARVFALTLTVIALALISFPDGAATASKQSRFEEMQEKRKTAARLEQRKKIERAVSYHRVFLPYWTTVNGFSTKIHIRNVSVLRPMEAALSLVGKNGSVKLDEIRIAPAQTHTIDIEQSLTRNQMAHLNEGSAFIDFLAESVGAINAYAQVINTSKSLAFSFPFQRQRPPGEASLDAVAWYYDRDTEIFISLQNPTEQVVTVTPRILVGRQQIKVGSVKLKAFEATTIKVPQTDPDETDRYPKTIGISIAQEGSALIAQGWSMSVPRGYSTGFAFIERSTGSCQAGQKQHLYGTGIPIGVSSMMGGAIFEPLLALRNTSSKSLAVTPIFSYMAGDTPQKVTLPAITLAPQESMVKNLRDYQVDGTIPGFVSVGGVNLQYESDTAALIAEMTSVDQSGFYTSQVPLVCRGGRALHTSYWRTDGDWDSILHIENISAEENNVEIIISHSGGRYVIEKRLKAGELAAISVKQLQQDRIPDRDGNFLPLSATGGGMNVWSTNVNHGLVINGLVVNAVTGTCGFCGDLRCAGLWLDRHSPELFLYAISGLRGWTEYTSSHVHVLRYCAVWFGFS